MKGKTAVSLLIAGALAFAGFQIYTILGTLLGSEKASETEGSGVIRSGKEEDARIAFACNVDWGEDILPDMLEILDDNDLKITFFVSGRWAENNPRMLRKIFLAGHEIQNHGYGHRMCSKISADVIRREIQKTEDAVMNLTGVKTNIFAPPSGDFDDKTVEVCQEMGYIISLWSIDTIDWRQGSTADVIRNRVFNKSLKGGILLMHPKEETVKALPIIIKKIHEKGLSIVSVSDLIT
ncbi:polysaccharide deacetylase family protein [Bacillota bacterium]